jgi:predicted aspartyl protease
MQPDAPALEGSHREVGHVTTTLTVTNRADQLRVKEDRLPADRVRTMTIPDVMVDTGATLLCLPADVIARLGLEFKEEVPVLTASGPGTRRVFRDATLRIEDREADFDCMELDPGGPALLGVIPLERLGFEPDLRNRRLRRVPPERHILLM